MNIHLTSSLTPDDENSMVPALLRAVSGILDLLPIAYVIRIETSDAQVYQQGGSTGHRAYAAEHAGNPEKLLN